MFYSKFCTIVSCSVNKVIIEEPSCTGWCESIHVFKHFSLLFSHCSLYKADEIKVLDSLVVAVVSDFRNHLCCFSLYLFYLSMSRLNCGDQNYTSCSRCGRTRDFYNWMISSLSLYLKVRAMNPSTLLALLQLFSVCFCHFRSLVMMIPRSCC